MTIILSFFSATAHAKATFIAGLVFLDSNQNGFHDENEPTKEGDDIYLNDLTLQQQGKSSHFHTETNSSGEFYFLVDNVGDYEIETD